MVALIPGVRRPVTLFKFKVVVGLKNIPAACPQSSCANVEFPRELDVEDDDDGREIVAGAWCIHPDLVPDEKILVIPERRPPHVVEPPLFLREHELIHSD